MKFFYLDKKQNKVYSFTSKTRTELEKSSLTYKSYLDKNMIRITKADARKVYKEQTAKFTISALNELNLPVNELKIGLDHANKLVLAMAV